MVCGTPERRLDGEAERATRRSKGGGGAGGLQWMLRLGLGHGVIQGLFCRAAGSHWRAGLGKRSSPGGDSGSKREREGRRVLDWAGCWAGRGPCGERREEGNGLPGREGAGPRGGGNESRPSCGVGLPSLLSSSFLFLFYTQTVQTNLFESK
jgi:hypothetical protein